ncbi:hypothetical protein, partial [Salmonella enterica]|uniref:hypothetical protein n=1 Tax=Salmonella enterica TaxID=28901 RepID=UPI001A9C5432
FNRSGLFAFLSTTFLESALSPITRTHPDTLAHSWRRGRAFYTKENPELWLGFVKMGGKRLR